MNEENYDDIQNKIARIEDMLILLLADKHFVDVDLANSAKKRLIKALILQD